MSVTIDGAPAIVTPRPPEPAPLSPEETAALVNRAKEIIAARLPPPPIPVPEHVEAFLRREMAEMPSPPTPEALRYLRDHMSLVAIYDGELVACYIAPDKTYSVLTAGWDNIKALLRELTAGEGSKVIVMDTMP